MLTCAALVIDQGLEQAMAAAVGGLCGDTVVGMYVYGEEALCMKPLVLTERHRVDIMTRLSRLLPTVRYPVGMDVWPGREPFTDLLTASICRACERSNRNTDVVVVTDQGFANDANRGMVEALVGYMATRGIRLLVLAIGPGLSDAELDMIVGPSCGSWRRVGVDRVNLEHELCWLMQKRHGSQWPLKAHVRWSSSSDATATATAPAFCTTSRPAEDSSIGILALVQASASSMEVVLNDSVWHISLVEASSCGIMPLAMRYGLGDGFGTPWPALKFGKKRMAVEPSRVGRVVFAVPARAACFTEEDGKELMRLTALRDSMHAAQEEEARLLRALGPARGTAVRIDTTRVSVMDLLMAVDVVGKFTALGVVGDVLAG